MSCLYKLKIEANKLHSNHVSFDFKQGVVYNVGMFDLDLLHATSGHLFVTEFSHLDGVQGFVLNNFSNNFCQMGKFHRLPFP